MPSWIDRQASKASRRADAERKSRELHEVWLARSRASAAFEKELVAKRQEERVETKRRALVPGTRQLPTISDADLALEAAKADPGPRHVAYPHLLILRERGYIEPVFECPDGALVTTYRGDRITEDGRSWLEKRDQGTD